MTRALLVGLVLGATLGITHGCVVPNPDHCLHRAIDANAWCAETFDDRTFCSPCVGDNFGCVGTEPTAEECPSYSPSAPSGGSDTGTTGTSE
jgi:hypothetical protein